VVSAADPLRSFQTHYLSENLVALRIEHGTSGSVARNSEHMTTGAVIHYDSKGRVIYVPLKKYFTILELDTRRRPVVSLTP
jgi:hypothetical protein